MVSIETMVLAVWGLWAAVIAWHLIVTAVLVYHWNKYVIETTRIDRLRTRYFLFSCVVGLVTTLGALGYSAAAVW